MNSKTDEMFAEVITAIADIRKSNRSVSIVVAPLFQPMVDHLSLTEFKNYILSRYPGDRGKSAYGYYDLVNIGESELKSFDRAFYYKDFLRIVFVYTDGWAELTRFQAVLLNDQL